MSLLTELNATELKSTADALMNSDAFVQKQKKSCAKDVSSGDRACKTQKAESNSTNMDAIGSLVRKWEESLAAVHHLPCFHSVEANKPGAGATPATTAPCSTSTSRCSSSSGRAPSLVERQHSAPGIHFPHAMEVFALLDKSGDRFIDASELSVFHEIACRDSIYYEILRLLYKAIDMDDNGKLDEHEWMNYVDAVVTKIGLPAWKEMASRVVEELSTPLDPLSAALRAAHGQLPYPSCS